MTPPPALGDAFRYDGYALHPGERRLVCRYALGRRAFTEVITFDAEAEADADAAGGTGDAGAVAGGADSGAGAGWWSAAADAAARIVYLLAGVSYYKTAAPEVVDLGTLATTAAERRFLRTFYVEGLAEFAYRNRLDLSGLRVEGPDAARPAVPAATSADRPLVPFGGGIDSIVTVESIRRTHPAASLFVVSRAGDRFDAIEQGAAVTGLPVVRAERRIDPALLQSATLGFLNGHVPVTGILSAIAVLAAVGHGHGAVVMSNERSASAATVENAGRPVNHQWSKSAAFEAAFRHLLASTFHPGVEYFSYLRGRSELWVAQRFASLDRYHRVFRSCNRAFHLDPARRLDRWCGECDKCCFIDLVLAPFVSRAELAAVFDGHEPLDDPALVPTFQALVGTVAGARPFECVGDEEECAAAAVLAARRPDRAGAHLLQRLATQAAAVLDRRGDTTADQVAGMDGPDFVPEAFALDAGAGAPAVPWR